MLFYSTYSLDALVVATMDAGSIAQLEGEKGGKKQEKEKKP